MQMSAAHASLLPCHLTPPSRSMLPAVREAIARTLGPTVGMGRCMLNCTNYPRVARTFCVNMALPT